ncbi:universal stress protein UspA-like nucleotide-binding protein [Companilactobacillus paralimentarius DSM 13238 = JCM 10415]|jgi:Universal stress protein UspA and related nucleotide-binding proteins|uniref:Universal stress protein UspA-like nucleotide-binding protein n=1 Tax=Companilactobacillus paralimentarius DSM 13238 = JCM 10415 TaxID=1122151 RepID=A0A0R1PCG3_9LACO|nr:universal stress protein [Companilactobacillus paralimentarius]KAE9564213.1 universal stress protein UspA [Companilactobacillus paralimentarius]KRL30151.1 universal stress protein UspA-like nucleotide-binding protein [Companilactobacillus paralimentarius DSM 13238 = JCM 10415]QFR68957.1 universal stress protein [Companilactobacillus paralimentarius]
MSKQNNTFERVLVGVDDSADAQLAFRYAMHRCIKDNSTLIITSILESGDMNVYQALTRDYVHGERKDLEEHMQEYRKVALDAGVQKVELMIGEGDPGETIVKDIIPAAKADLLVIGSLSKKGIRKYFGSQAAYMAKYSPISIMIIR